MSPPPWATEPPSWGEPVTWDKVRRDLAEMERKKVFRFAYPDGSQYETTWVDESSAKTWASINGHRYLGQVRDRIETPSDPRGTSDRGTEPPLTPPPLVKAERRPPPPPPAQETKPPPPERKPAKKRLAPLPPPKPEEYTIIDYLREDALRTTMTESMPLISKWFGRVGKALQAIPGLQAVGKAYETIGLAADGLSLVYELAHELKQSEALEKGSKQLVKRTKPVKKTAEALLKKKFPTLPEPARKKAADILEQLFEKYVTDPAIEKGKEEAKERDEGKELDTTLFDQLKKVLGTPPTATPATP